MNLLHLLVRFLNFLFRVPALERYDKTALIPFWTPKARKKEKQRTRQWWKLKRASDCAPKGSPVLTGLRLDRTIESCSPQHLTRLPLYANNPEWWGFEPEMEMERRTR